MYEWCEIYASLYYRSRYSDYHQIDSSFYLTIATNLCPDEYNMDSGVIYQEMKRGEALRLCKSTHNVDVIIGLSEHKDPSVRKAALKEMCPCRVKIDIDEFWDRVLSMVDDPDDAVRQQVPRLIQ